MQFWKSKSGSSAPEGVYHEKQSRELCALHALNNLFQTQGMFSKKDLDDICTTLSPESMSILNPHRSIIGLGNYDVNVVMAALQKYNYDMIWFDKRKNIEMLELKNIKGFILNVPSNLTLGALSLPIKRKHWITLCKVNDAYYNLDSKLNMPEEIGNDAGIKEFLKSEAESNEKELFIIIPDSIDRDSLWRSDIANSDTVKSDNAQEKQQLETKNDLNDPDAG